MAQSLAISDLFSVRDKVVLVTGGGRGVGRMISEGFIRNGAKVYIASRSAKDVQRAAHELSAIGPGTCIALVADLQKLEAAEELVRELGKREKALHVLVNNSGASWGESLEEYPDSAWTKLLTLNLQRVFTLTQKLLPLLTLGAESGTGRIINIGSINGESVSRLDTFAYSASKAGLHHLSRVLASHLAERGITSNTLACGPFPSKMTAGVFQNSLEIIQSGVPLGRVGQPHDIVAACLWLCGKGGEWITGATIPVEGGFLVSKAKM